MSPAGRADAHIHLFRGGFSDDERDEVTWYESLRAQAGIETALVIGYEGDRRFRGNNSFVLELSQRLKWVRPTAFVDAAAPPAPRDLVRLREEGFVGWSIYLPDDGASLADWSPEHLEALRSGILSVNASPMALAQAGTALASMADTRVLISHLGLPGSKALDAGSDAIHTLLGPLLELSALPQISVKLSGLYAIDGRYPHTGARSSVDAVLSAFGSGRVAWGSDFSPVTAAVASDEVMDAPPWVLDGLSPSERDDVQGGTLLRHLAHVDSIERTDS